MPGFSCNLSTSLEEFRSYLKGTDSPIVFDTETMGLSIFAPVVCCSFYDGKRKAVSFFTDALFPDGISYYDFEKVMREEFPKLKVIGHNIKYDIGITKAMGVKDPAVVSDTALMVHVYNPDYLKKLEVCVQRDLGVNKKTYEEIINKKWDKVDWTKDVQNKLITKENLGTYAAEDVYYTYQLYKHYEKKLDDKMWKVLNDIEIPLIYVLRDMHHYGVKTDKGVLKNLEEKLSKEISRLEKDIYKEAGVVFNLNSPKQKAEILFDTMKLPCYTKTVKGNRSTDSDTLGVLAEEGYKIAELIVNWSELNKLQTTYVQAIPKLMDSDGRLRCSFNTDGARTGRFSSSNPNLQNQPNNKKFPIRAAYVPEEGHKLVVADLSQIEPRIMAHLSQDPKMLKIYKDSGDIYLGIATDLGITRPQAKIVQLAISYGLGFDNLARQLSCSVNSAKGIISSYYSTYRVFKLWKEHVEKQAVINRCVYTMFGRVRLLSDVKNPANRGAYFSSLRKAVNTKIQGSAADIIKLSMVNLNRKLDSDNTGAKLLLTVHDELLLETPEYYVAQAHDTLVDCMQNTVKLSIPIIAEAKVVNNWSQMKDDSFKSLITQYRSEFPYYLI